MGSVAEELVRKSACPVVTVKSLPAESQESTEEAFLDQPDASRSRQGRVPEVQEYAISPIRTIMHPTDFSDHTKRAFHLA